MGLLVAPMGFLSFCNWKPTDALGEALKTWNQPPPFSGQQVGGESLQSCFPALPLKHRNLQLRFFPDGCGGVGGGGSPRNLTGVQQIYP